MIADLVLEISSLSDSEYICLVAAYYTLATGEKNKVSKKASRRGYSAEALAQAKAALAEKFQPVETGSLRFTKPFDCLKFESLPYVLTLHDNYERGLLPFPGSVSEQPAQIMEIFNVLRSLKHEFEMKSNERATSNVRDKYKNKPRTRR